MLHGIITKLIIIIVRIMYNIKSIHLIFQNSTMFGKLIIVLKIEILKI